MLTPELVDKALTPGAYANWFKVQESFIDEQTRAYANAGRLLLGWSQGLKEQLQADLAFAGKVSDDYIAFLQRVSSNPGVDVTEGEKILGVFVLAVSILMYVNDVLEEIFKLGIAALFATLAGLRFEMDATAVQSLLKKLQVELERAKREIKEAWVQTALDGAITVVLACAGPLGWLTLGAVGLGQMVADTYLGPSTPDAATWGNRGSTTLGTAVSASEKYLQETSKLVRYTKPAGKVLPVIGFVFDANELSIGYRNAADLKKAMSSAKKAHDDLIAKIKAHKASISSLGVKMATLNTEVRKMRSDGWIGTTRSTLDAEMKRNGYRPGV